MDSRDELTDIVHPEVRAHITSLVAALGGIDEDGTYQLGDDGLDVLRDIKRWIRFYDQKMNRMDVARCLAEANLVEGDLLHILATWNENSTAQRFRARVALACYEILTPLTWPFDRDRETTTVNHYRHLPALQLAQVAYKRAIINYDGAEILRTAVRVALPSMAISLGERSLRDHGIIKLMLYFLRNVAMIEPPPGAQYDSDESQVGRSATIDAFSFQDIFMVLLTIASNMGEDFRTEDTALLEILFHIVKSINVRKLFMDEAQLNKTNANELTDMLNKESAMLHAVHQNGPTRHSRFGTMVWIDRGKGKVSTLSGPDVLVSAAAREHKLDSSKKFRPPRRRGRRDEKADMAGPGPTVVLNIRANGQLRKFVEEFLDAGFNPLFQHIRKSIDRDAPHVLHYHRAQFLYLVAWFLEAERVRQKSRRKQAAGRDASQQREQEISSFNLVAGVLNQEMFIFLGRALDRSQNDKDWQELTVVMRCFSQILLTVQDMSESKSEEDEEIADNILSRLFYEETTHDAIANIVKNFKDQGYEFLDACTELAYTYLRILEAYSKQNVDMQIRSRRRTRKKKKATAASVASTDRSASGKAKIGPLDAPGDDDDEGSDADVAAAQKTSTERKFDFHRFANRFVVQGVVDTFAKFTTNYRDLTDAQLKRAHRYFYRVAFKQEMSVMLFRVDIIRLLYNMIKGPEPLDRHSSMYKEWEELAKQILRKCFKKLEERPVLIIEMLFSKSASTAHFLEYGYEKQTLSTTNPRPGAELEFRHIVERDRQIAIVTSVLLHKNQHELVDWVKNTLATAEAERRSTQMTKMTIPSEHNGTENPSEVSLALSVEHSDRGTLGAPIALCERPQIIVHPADDACKKAMFKNSHLRLLMKLAGIERQSAVTEETPDAVWVVPSSVTADELKESRDLICQAEFEPPIFENGELAEDQLRRKPVPRKKAVYDDDEAGNEDYDDILFPAGGPTTREVIDEDLDGRSRGRQRKRRKQDSDDNDDDDDDDMETARRARAQRRQQKELEKARRIKSDLFVHASDDETDEERDKAFYAREALIMQRVHRAVLDGTSEATTASAATAAAATTKAGNLSSDALSATKRSERQKRARAWSDDEDENEDYEDIVEGKGRIWESEGSLQTSKSGSFWRRNPAQKRDRSTETAPAEYASNTDGDATLGGREPLAKKSRRRMWGRRSGFLGDSSDADASDSVIDKAETLPLSHLLVGRDRGGRLGSDEIDTPSDRAEARHQKDVSLTGGRHKAKGRLTLIDSDDE